MLSILAAILIFMFTSPVIASNAPAQLSQAQTTQVSTLSYADFIQRLGILAQAPNDVQQAFSDLGQAIEQACVSDLIEQQTMYDYQQAQEEFKNCKEATEQKLQRLYKRTTNKHLWTIAALVASALPTTTLVYQWIQANYPQGTSYAVAGVIGVFAYVWFLFKHWISNHAATKNTTIQKQQQQENITRFTQAVQHTKIDAINYQRHLQLVQDAGKLNAQLTGLMGQTEALMNQLEKAKELLLKKDDHIRVVETTNQLLKFTNEQITSLLGNREKGEKLLERALNLEQKAQELLQEPHTPGATSTSLVHQ